MISNMSGGGSGGIKMPTLETWVLSKKAKWKTLYQKIVFCNDGYFRGEEHCLYTSIRDDGDWVLFNDSKGFDDSVYELGAYSSGEYNATLYRGDSLTLTFFEPPTGELLTWLQANAVKQ